MKLLLTSGGLTNNSIANALFELVGKKPEDTKIVFIPTASNIEAGDKDWFINDLVNLQKRNFAEIDIADISAVDRKIWEPKLRNADVLFFEGGNTYHLMDWVQKSGLKDLLPELLKDKVYVGLSAGSMITNPDLALKISQIVYGEDLDKTEEMVGLNYVDFYFLPHLNSEWFPNMRRSFIENATKEMASVIYVLDDQSALKVVNGNIEVISEGEWFVLNK
ncbi:MAG: Type 1 glutamine amidotransferase-like domain-containing protein [bacterium]|nr:Type 1 glutamine amidotransferase-like domain-containing protein [bacterium]